MYRILVLTGLLVSFGVFYLLTSFTYSDLLPLDTSLAQIIIGPIVVLVVLGCRLLEPRVPVIPALILLSGVMLSAFYRFRYPLEAAGGGALIAQLADDKIFNKTRIFREKINSYLSNSEAANARSLHQSFSSLEEVSGFLEEHRSVGTLVWGSQRWIQLAFRREPPITLREIGIGTDYYGLGDLKLIQSVPVIGLSYEPFNATTRFISEIVYDTSHVEERSSSFGGLSEIALEAAGLQGSGWSSGAHRAYPWWRLGNRHLLAGIHSKRFSLNSLRCAEKAYEKGLGFLRTGDNPELRGALYNNHGITVALQAFIERRPRLLFTAMRDFRMSTTTLFEKDPFKVDLVAGHVAYDNLVQLVEAGAKKKAMRGKGHVRSKVKNRKLSKKKSGRKNSKRATRKRT